MIDRKYNLRLDFGDAQFLLEYLDTSLPGYIRDHVDKCDMCYIEHFVYIKNLLWNTVYGEEVK